MPFCRRSYVKMRKRYSVIFLILIVAVALTMFVSCSDTGGEVSVVKIVVSTLPKTDYYLGDAFELGNAKLTVTYENGKTETVPLEATMISGFNSNKLGEQTLTIRYKDVSEYLTVNVKTAPVYSLQIESTLHKTEYVVGESLSVKDLNMLVTYSNGRTAILPVEENMVSGFDSSAPGEKQLVVSYGNKTCNMTVTIVPKKVMQRQLQAPSKLTYIVGDTVDFTGGTIFVSYNDNSSEYLDLKNLFDTNKISVLVDNETSTLLTKSQLACTVTIYYDGQAFSYIISVEDIKATSAAVTHDVSDQIMGSDAFDFSAGIVTVTYNNKEVHDMSFNDERITLDTSACDINAVGKYNLGISVGGIEFKYQINVISPSPERLVILPLAVTYYQGENIDITQWEYSIYLNNGKKQVLGGVTESPVNEEMFIGNTEDIDTFKVGKQTLGFKITASNSSVLYYDVEIEILAKTIVSLEIINSGKRVYSEGDVFSLSGITLIPTYNNGDVGDEAAVTSPMLRDESGNVLDTTKLLKNAGETGKTEKTVYVQFDDAIYDTSFTGSFTILLVRKAVSLEFITTPRTEYILGEQFDCSDWDIKITFGDGTTTTVSGKNNGLSGEEWQFVFIKNKGTADEIITDGFDGTGKYEVVLYYGGGSVSLSCEYNVTNEIVSISLNEVHLGFFTEGTEIIPEGTEITVIRENGETEIIPITKGRLSINVAPVYLPTGEYTSSYFRADELAANDYANDIWEEKHKEYYVFENGNYTVAEPVYDLTQEYFINIAAKYSEIWNDVWFNFYVDENGTKIKAEKQYEVQEFYYLADNKKITVYYGGKEAEVFYTVVPKTITSVNALSYKEEYILSDNEWDIKNLSLNVGFDNATALTVRGIESGNSALLMTDEKGWYFTYNSMRYGVEIGVFDNKEFISFTFAEFAEELRDKIESGNDKFHSRTFVIKIADAVNEAAIISAGFDIYCFEELISYIKLVAGEFSEDVFNSYKNQTVYINEGKGLLEEGFVLDDDGNKQLIKNSLYLFVYSDDGSSEYYALGEAEKVSSSFELSDYSDTAIQQAITVGFLRKACTIGLELRLNVISSVKVTVIDGTRLSVIEKMDINPDDMIIEVSYTDADGVPLEETKIVDFRQVECEGYSKYDNWEFGDDGTVNTFIKISYGGFACENEIPLTVKRKSLVSINLTSMPRLEYVENPTDDISLQTKIDFTGGKVSLRFDNGTTQVLDLSDGNLSKNTNNFNANKELTGGSQEQQTIYVSYTYYGVTQQTSYNVIIVDRKYVSIQYDQSLGYEKKLICEYGAGEEVLPEPTVLYYQSFNSSVATELERGAADTLGQYHVSYRNAEGVLSDEWPTAVGIYTVRYTYFENSGDANNNAFSDETVTIEIKKKELAIVIEDFSFVYGEILNGNNDDALKNIKNSSGNLKWKMTAVTNGIPEGEAYCYGDTDDDVISEIKLYIYDKNTGVRKTLIEYNGDEGYKVLVNLSVGEYVIKPEISLVENANYELSALVSYAEADLTVIKRPIVIAVESVSKVYGDSDPDYQFRVYNYEDVIGILGDIDLNLVSGNQIIIREETDGLKPIGTKKGIHFAYDNLIYTGDGIFDLTSEIIYTDTSTLEYNLTRATTDTDDAGDVHPIYSGAPETLSNYEIMYCGGNLEIEQALILVAGEDLIKNFGTSKFIYNDGRETVLSEKMKFFASKETPVLGGDSFESLFENYFDDGSIIYYNYSTGQYALEIVGECDDWGILYKNVKIYRDKACTDFAADWGYKKFTVSGLEYEGNYSLLPFNLPAGEYYVLIDTSSLTLKNYALDSYEAEGEKYSFSIHINKITAEINVKSFVVSGNSQIKDQNNGTNGRLLASYFAGDDFTVEIIDKDTFDTEIDALFKDNIISITYLDIDGSAVEYRLSKEVLLSQFEFIRDTGDLNVGIHNVNTKNTGNDFDIALYSEYSSEIENPKPYVQHFYDSWKNRYEILALTGDYSTGAYILVIPEFIKIGYGKSLSYDSEGKAVFTLSEAYARKYRSDFDLTSYCSLDGASYTPYAYKDGISYQIVHTDIQYASSNSMVAGIYTGTMTYSYFDTDTKNYLYLGSTMVLEASAAAHILNYIFDETYGSGTGTKPMTYTESFKYEVTTVKLKMKVVDTTSIFNEENQTVSIQIINGDICPGDSLSLTFDLEITYNQKDTETLKNIGLASYSIDNGEAVASGLFTLVNAGNYIVKVVDLGNTNYSFDFDEDGQVASYAGMVNIKPIDIPIYINYPVDDGDGNPLTITKTYQAGESGINPIDTAWKKASDSNSYYSYGTTTCYIVKEYYSSADKTELLYGNLDFMPSNLIISTADENGNYPRNVKRDEDGNIEGYPISYRIVNSDFINYAVVFVYKTGEGNNFEFIKFADGDGYELVIQPKTVNLYGFGTLNNKVYDGNPASVRSTDSALTLIGDYNTDKINKNNLVFTYERPQSEMMIGDYQYIRDNDGISASANITDAGTLMVRASYMDDLGNMNYDIVFADESVQYVDENGVRHNNIGIYTIYPGTVTFDLKNAVNPYLSRQYDGYGLTNRENLTFTGTANELIVLGNGPIDSISEMVYKLELKGYGTSTASFKPIPERTEIGTTTYGNEKYNVGYYWYNFRGVFLPEGNADGEYITFESKDPEADDWLSWNYRFAVQQPTGSSVDYHGCDGIYYISPRDVYVVINPTDNADGTLNVNADEENVPSVGNSQYQYLITYNGYTYGVNVTDGTSSGDGKYYFDLAKSLNANEKNGLFKYGLYVYDSSSSEFTNIKYIENLKSYYTCVEEGFNFGATSGIYDANSSPVNAGINALIEANKNFNFVNSNISFRVRARKVNLRLSLINIVTRENEMTYGTSFGAGEGLYFSFDYADGKYEFINGYDTNLSTINNIINEIINSSGGQLTLLDDGRVCSGFPVYVAASMVDESKYITVDGVKYVKISGETMNSLSANKYDSNNQIIERYLTGGTGLSSDTSKYEIVIEGTNFRISRKEIEIIGVERAYFDKDTDNYKFKVNVPDMDEDEANSILEIENSAGNMLKDYIIDNTSIAVAAGTWVRGSNDQYYVRIPSSMFTSNDSNYIVRTTVVNESLVESEWDGISVNNGIYVYLPLTVAKAKIIIDYQINSEVMYGDIFDSGETVYNGLPTLNSFGIYTYINHATGEEIKENGIYNVNNDSSGITLQQEQNLIRTGVSNAILLDLLREKAANSEVSEQGYSYNLGEFVSETPIFDNYEIVWGIFNYIVVKKEIEISMNVVEKSYSIGEGVYNDYFSALWSERNQLYYAGEIDSTDTRDRRLGYTVSIEPFSVNGTEYNNLAEQIALILGAEYNIDSKEFEYNGMTYKNINEFMSAICNYSIYVYREGDETLAESGGTIRFIALSGLESENFELKFKRSEIMLYPEIEGIGRYTTDSGYANLIADTESTREGVIVNISENTISGLSILLRYNFGGFIDDNQIQYVDTKRSADYSVDSYAGMTYDRRLTIKYIPEYSSVNLSESGQPAIGDVLTVQIILEESFYGGEIVRLLESNYFSVTMKQEGTKQTGYSDTILDKASGGVLKRENIDGTEGLGDYLSQQAAVYKLADSSGSDYIGKFDIINLRARLVPVNAGESARKFEIILYENDFGKLVLGYKPDMSYVRMMYNEFYIEAKNNYPGFEEGEIMLKDELAEYCRFELATKDDIMNDLGLDLSMENIDLSDYDIPDNLFYEKIGNGFILTKDEKFISAKSYYYKKVVEDLGDDISSQIADLYVNYSESVISSNLINLFDGGNHSFSIYIDKVGAFSNVGYNYVDGIPTSIFDEENGEIIGETKVNKTTITADRIFTVRVSVDERTYIYSFIGEPYDYSLKETYNHYNDGRGDEYIKEYTTYLANFFTGTGKVGIDYDSLKVMISKFTIQNRLIGTATNNRYIANVVFWPAGEDSNDIPYITNEGTAQNISEILSQVGNVTISGGEEAMDAYNSKYNDEKNIISVTETTTNIENIPSYVTTEPGLYIIKYVTKYNYGNNQEYELNEKTIRVLITENNSEQIILDGKKIDSSSPQSYSDGYYFTNDLQNEMSGVSGLTYIFDSVKFNSDSGVIWMYFKLTDTEYRNLSNRYPELPEASGIALRIEKKLIGGIPSTTARVMVSRQLPNDIGSYDRLQWNGTEKTINFAEDSSVVNILKITLTRVERDIQTGDVIAKDDNGIRMYDDTVITFRLYQHTTDGTELVFEDYVKTGFGTEVDSGSGISRTEIENVVLKPGSAHYAGIGLENASIRLVDMFSNMPVNTSVDYVGYTNEDLENNNLIKGSYTGNDEILTSGKIYMATDKYDTPMVYAGNAVNIRFKAEGTQGGFRYYFGMNTPYYISNLSPFGDIQNQRGLMIEYNKETGSLMLYFYKYNTLYRRQEIFNEESGINLCDGQEHQITMIIDYYEVLERPDSSSSVPKDNYEVKIFIDSMAEKIGYIPVGNDLSNIEADDYSSSNDSENNKDLLFMKGAYYMGFEVLGDIELSVYDCIGFQQNTANS